MADDRTVDAVARNLEVVGEAVKQVPAELREAHQEIAWRQLAGLRDVVIHQYFGLDLDLIWDVAHTQVAPLRGRIVTLLDSLPLDN